MTFHVSWLRLILLIEVQKSYFVVGLRFWIYYLFAEKLFNVDEHVSNVQTPCSENQPKIKVLGFRWIWGVFGIFRFSKRVIFREDIWITSLMDQNHVLSQHESGSKWQHRWRRPFLSLTKMWLGKHLKNHMAVHFGICDNSYLFTVCLAMKSLSCVFPWYFKL